MTCPEYRYSAVAERVIDGDTIDVYLDFGFSIKQKMRLRLYGIDTPELNSKDEDERARAKKAKDFVYRTLFYEDTYDKSMYGWHSNKIVVRTIKTKAGKERQTFGRYVAEVYVRHGDDWASLNDLLVEEGLAVRSSG